MSLVAKAALKRWAQGMWEHTSVRMGHLSIFFPLLCELLFVVVVTWMKPVSCVYIARWNAIFGIALIRKSNVFIAGHLAS